MVGEECESRVGAADAFVGVSGQVQRPGHAGMQPGRKGVQLNGSAQQFDCVVKTVAAEGEHDAQAGGPGIVGQMPGHGKCMQGRGQIVVDMKADPAQRRENGFGMMGKSLS